MVLRVVDRDGTVLHDCREMGCSVSWDGLEIATGKPAPGRPDRTQLEGFELVGEEARRV